MWHQPVSVTNAGDGVQDHHLNSATRHQQGISHSAAAAHVQAAGIRDAMTRTLMPSPYGTCGVPYTTSRGPHLSDRRFVPSAYYTRSVQSDQFPSVSRDGTTTEYARPA